MKNAIRLISIGITLALIFVLSSCTKEGKAKDVVMEYLKSRAKDPTSIEILSMEVLNDTLPIYLEGSLSKEIEELPKLCEEAQKPSFFYSQKSKQNKLQEFVEKIRKQLSERRNKRYNIALVEASGNNVLGAKSSLDVIIILDENNEKVLAHFWAKDYIKIVPIIYNMVYEENLPVNEFGNVEIEKLPRIDGYIMSSAN